MGIHCESSQQDLVNIKPPCIFQVPPPTEDVPLAAASNSHMPCHLAGCPPLYALPCTHSPVLPPVRPQFAPRKPMYIVLFFFLIFLLW